MRLSTKTLIILIIGMLAIGFALGWFLFDSESSARDHAHATEGNQEIWTCSMHPQIRQPEPGDCPICGMDLIPLSQEQDEGINPDAIKMSATAMQLANIQTAQVDSRIPVKTVRLNGKVQEDERLTFTQSSHIPGRIEQLKINSTGAYIRKGQVIASIYSPELVTAQKELLEAQKLKDMQPELFATAKEKLKRWKLSDEQINKIILSDAPKLTFPITADFSGYVTDKLIELGSYVKSGEPLYRVTNLSRVWVLFDVHESNIPWVHTGDSVNFSVRSIPGKVFKSKITYVDPIIDSQTRVAKARVELENKNRQIKPGMLANGKVDAQLNSQKKSLVVPKSAVMWTGTRSVVYVKTSTDQGTYFKMKKVVLGPALGDAYMIESGISKGDEIAINGTFSIDAAAQLANKPSMMNQRATQQTIQNIEVNEWSKSYEVPSSFQQQIQNIYEAYLPIKDGLVDDSMSKAQEAANALYSQLNKVKMENLKAEVHQEWMNDADILKQSTQALSDAESLKGARNALSPLSNQLYHILKKFQVNVEAYRQYCPMALDNQGAYWLSDREEIRNPYFGESMLNCGQVEEEL